MKGLDSLVRKKIDESIDFAIASFSCDYAYTDYKNEKFCYILSNRDKERIKNLFKKLLKKNDQSYDRLKIQLGGGQRSIGSFSYLIAHVVKNRHDGSRESIQKEEMFWYRKRKWLYSSTE